MVNGAYTIKLPVSFFPQYKKHEVLGKNDKPRPYAFSCKMAIHASEN